MCVKLFHEPDSSAVNDYIVVYNYVRFVYRYIRTGWLVHSVRLSGALTPLPVASDNMH